MNQDALLQKFWTIYDRSFVLPDEKETMEGFLACLAFNQAPLHAPLRDLYGPFRECLVVMEEDEPVAAANFFAFTTPEPRQGQRTSLHLSYACVAPEHRRRGHLRGLIDACRQGAVEAVGPSSDGKPPLVFLEMNNPDRLTAEEEEQDRRVSGLTSEQRLAIWRKHGVRILDLPYVQPPPSADQGAEEGLLLGVIGGSSEPLPSSLVASYLERFLGISVLKTGRARENACAAALIHWVEAREAIGYREEGKRVLRKR